MVHEFAACGIMSIKPHDAGKVARIEIIRRDAFCWPFFAGLIQSTREQAQAA
jgi:hypothetical protein